jgi:hypothetical protein
MSFSLASFTAVSIFLSPKTPLPFRPSEAIQLPSVAPGMIDNILIRSNALNLIQYQGISDSDSCIEKFYVSKYSTG